MLASEISTPGVIIVLGTSVTVSLPGIWRSLVMCQSDERLQMVGALLSAHGCSCQELIQEQVAFPMLFRLHMRIEIELHHLDGVIRVGRWPQGKARAVRVPGFH